ncbi:LAMI_0H14598g1_1 [Lachancea mirantina]|uniref:Structural maintenance of chromosomes protein n=1 Tax=Lachancea mirantina TaxID=1230905 RepID=A0A1G4KIF2_9SACH|nr:LAMI_0H14598g1_1 [Lachancea mirantina]
MYVKRIVIQGFKTYKNTTVIEDLSPNLNVVVGSNGSGKSNLFAALRFVLTDAYKGLRREERHALIHQGTGSVMSAFVEIEFNDPEGQMAISTGLQVTQAETIKVRRTIGLKKDEYSINGKTCHKGDIARMLESVGFSPSNPYNIVPQGRIVAVTNAKDEERLSLLEEVVGAKSFEAKLQESLNKMETTNKDSAKIEAELTELQERLDELDEERRDLEKYQALERDRKAFQFLLYDRELNEVTNSIEKVEDEYSTTLKSSEKYIEELEKRESLVADINKTLQKTEADTKIKEANDLKSEKARFLEASERKATLQARYKEIQKQSKEYNEQNVIDRKSLAIIKEEIKKKEQELQELTPRFKDLTAEKAHYKNQISELENIVVELQSKRGKYARFETQVERDTWLGAEMVAVEQELIRGEKELQEVEFEIQKTADVMAELNQQIDELSDSVSGPGIEAEMQDLDAEIDACKNDYLHRLDERKELWRAEQKLQAIRSSSSDALKKSERDLEETMDRGLASGLRAVNEIVERLKLPPSSVHGPLGELLKVSPKYKTCAEVVGGNSLFHVVVENDEVASILMNELFSTKSGRITFIPLNRIQTRANIEYPSNAEGDCTPLILKIKCDKKYEAAMNHVFGKTIVVRDLVTGSRLAKKYKLDAVTLDGDRANSRGVVSGGYHDYHKKAKLDCLKEIMSVKSQHQKAVLECESLGDQVAEIDAAIDQANSKLKQCAKRKEAIQTDAEQLRWKLNKKRSELILLDQDAATLRQKREKLKFSLKLAQDKLAIYGDDLTKPFVNELSSDENQQINELSRKIKESTKIFTRITEDLSSLINKLDNLNAEIDSKLKPQEKYLINFLDEMNEDSMAMLKQKLERLEPEIKDAKALEDLSRENLEQTRNELAKLKEESTNNQRILEKANSQQRSLLKNLEKFQKDAEKVIIRKTTLSNRRDELQQKISEIGLLSEESVAQHERLGSSEILDKLKAVNNKLSSMTNVNKRAIENFKRFSEKREELVGRAEELVSSQKSIEQLIISLKKQKVEGVETTFKKVASNFTTLFEMLVPNGKGQLLIHRREDNESTQSSKKSKDSAASRRDDYIGSAYSGVSMKVSFNSKSNEQTYVEQLSGGQKTVCAIALILAIQMVDPAPFYLFDEIDAALDKQYRTSVANVMSRLSSNAQFICTTFRTDLLQVANNFYRVKFENRVSSVTEVSKQSAINFIQGRNKLGDI